MTEPSRVSRIRRHKAVRPLIRFAAQAGFTVIFHERTLDWAYGYIDFAARKIGVYVADMAGVDRPLGDVVFTLAHEIRHLEHTQLGLYAAYYDDSQGHLGGKAFICGIAAERNCDRYARTYLEKYNLIGSKRLIERSYPSWRVEYRCLYGSVKAYRDIVEYTFENSPSSQSLIELAKQVSP